MNEFLDRIWDGITDDYKWIRGVILGEWDDDRSLSQVVADALIGFVPGVGSIVTLRDLIAVIFRLAKYPEKRDDVDEWILLIAMLVPLIITVLGAAAAGIGALVGEEVGGFLRAVALFLVKKGGVALKVLVDFLHAHGYGSAIKALREVKFAKYQTQVSREMSRQVVKLQHLLGGFIEKLEKLHADDLPDWLGGDKMRSAIASARHWIGALDELGRKARDMIPQTLIEMDQRLGSLLAGDIKGATQTTHAMATGIKAPAVERAVDDTEHHVARNTGQLEPGNTRRVSERRVMHLSGKREYSVVDQEGRPVGAKPYKPGDKLDNSPVRVDDWDELYAPKVKQGWPDLADGEEYQNFSGKLQANSLPAGSKTTLERVVGKGKPWQDGGGYYNRELPVDGQDLRTSSAVKEEWNNDGEHISLSVPPKEHPVWKELHALQEQTADGSVPYAEELKFWEGAAASQKYEVTLDNGGKVADEWAFPGGKDQQFLSKKQIQLLKKHGFISERKPTNFPDYDPKLNNIVPKDGPAFEVVPLDQAVPAPKGTKP